MGLNLCLIETSTNNPPASKDAGGLRQQLTTSFDHPTHHKIPRPRWRGDVVARNNKGSQ